MSSSLEVIGRSLVGKPADGGRTIEKVEKSAWTAIRRFVADA